MLVNIVAFFVILVLAFVSGWFTWRVFHSKKMLVKIIGGLFVGLITLVLFGMVFFSAKGFVTVYLPDVRPSPDIKVAGTMEQVTRGEYLVGLSCIGCHSKVDESGNPGLKQPLSGGWDIARAEGFGFMGTMVTENLTPGGKLAMYTDGDLFRALRYGIDQNGHRLGFMSLLSYGQLSDEDVLAIIAYLRSLPPTETQMATGSKINFVGLVIYGSGMFPIPDAPSDTVAAPVQAVSAEYGKYVALIGDCSGCHGPDVTGVEESPLSPAVPNPRYIIATWTQAEFAQTMRTGMRPNGMPFPDTMPWQNASKMTDDDLTALYLYLTSPVRNEPQNTQPSQ